MTLVMSLGPKIKLQLGKVMPSLALSPGVETQISMMMTEAKQVIHIPTRKEIFTLRD